MAKRVKNSLASKLGDTGRKAVAAHKNDETKFGGGGELPPGIDGGIAQLVDCKFDTYKSGDNQGEFYFYAAGVVVEPTTHNNIRVKGLRTSIMEPVCDTPTRSRKTVEEHIEWILNELRKLGVDTAELDLDDLEAVAESLRETKPYFRFRTWQGEATKQYPNPMTFHQWRGVVEDYEAEEEDDVEDDTVEEDKEPTTEADRDDLTALGEAADGDDEDAQTQLTALAEKAGVDPEEFGTWAEVAAAIDQAESSEEEEEDNDGDEEIEADISPRDLGDLADDGDEECEAKLTALAEKAGVDPDEYETWTALGEAIQKQRAEGTKESLDFEPEKGEVYFYKPPKARKPIECEVSAVFTGRRTVNLRGLDDGRTFKSVSWDKLEYEE